MRGKKLNLMYQRRTLIAFFLSLFLFTTKSSVRAAPRSFPEGGKIFQKLLADPEEINSGGLFSRDDGVNVVDFSIGNHFGMRRWQFGKTSDWTAQWGFSFVVFGRILGYDEMKANDFIVNLPFEFRRGRFSGRLTFGHESAHLGDEFISRTGENDIKFSREFIQGIVALELTESIRIYGGYTSPLRTSSDRDPEEFQAGLELRTEDFQFLLDHQCWFYISHDFQLKKEVGWRGNNNAQAGLAISFSKKDQRLRFFANYFDGFSNFGQFFSQREHTLALGIAFDH